MSWQHELNGMPEANIDWMDGDSFAVQLDGNDIVHVYFDEEGKARVHVFEGTNAYADVQWSGTVLINHEPGEEGQPL